MLERVAGTKGVAGGELCGGRRLRVNWGFGLRWFPITYERLGSSARLRGVEWCRWMGGGGPARDELDRSMAAAVVAGDEEDDVSRTIAGYAGAMRVA